MSRLLTPERVAHVVSAWARLYTRGLPAVLAQRRRDELAADLHDQLAHERAAGTRERQIALALASRALRSLPADVAWRTRAASPRTSYRLGVASTLFNVLFLLWLMAAVGIIGVEGDPADEMYLGLLGCGLVGAVAVRFRPAGMARVLTVLALALLPVALVALLAGRAAAPASSVPELLGLNLMFGLLFGVSAALFRHAATARA